MKTFEEVHKIKPDIPVIMVTGYSVEELAENAVEKGAYACVHKPLDMDVILKMVEEIKNKKK